MSEVICLSHFITTETPLYGARGEIEINRLKSIDNGDSCTSSMISMPLHAGTHVDCPAHFVKGGKEIGDYDARDWRFFGIKIFNIEVKKEHIISCNDLEIEINDPEVEMVIIKTSFERYRESEEYWKNSPGVDPELKDYLLQHYPNIKMLGFDFISLTSFQHREIGRQAHKRFLGDGIRILEDMNLVNLPHILSSVIVAPLQVEVADGAPCYVLGFK